MYRIGNNILKLNGSYLGIIPSLPVVSTASITVYSYTTATVGGVLISDGRDTTIRGICWNTSGNPTIADSHQTNGTGIGAYSINLTGLTDNQIYYVRAYAINSVGTSYGTQTNFTTVQITTPSVSTQAATSITSTGATLNGTIVNINGASITDRGFAYATGSTPTTGGTHVHLGAGAVGVFNSNISGLNASSIYYVRSFAQNSKGMVYGNEINFQPDPWVIGLLYKWGFDDTLADSVTGLVLTATGAYSYQTGKIGKGVRTDVNNTWLYTTDATLRAALGGYNPFTISCWFNLTVTTARFQTMVFNSTNSNSGNNSYYVNWDSGAFRFRNRTGSETQITTTAHTGWNHAVITFDGTTTKAYHDSVIRYNALNNTSLTVTNFAWCDYQDNQHNHIIDLGRIYNYAMTQEQVTALFNAGV